MTSSGNSIEERQRHRVVVTPVGRSRGHVSQGPTDVTSFLLCSPFLTVEVWSHGARLVAVNVPDRNTVAANVILRYAGLHDYDDPQSAHGYLGATIGRTANRIANARFELGDTEYRLSANDGLNHLHGGAIGFDQHVWASTSEATTEHATVEMTLERPAGDQGYPGDLTMTTLFRLSENILTIETTATTSSKTIVGTTNHAYWDLAGTGTVKDHTLLVEASGYVPVDDQLIPLGTIANVGGTVFDFRSRRMLGPVLDGGGLDHCLVLDPEESRQVILEDPGSGRAMRMTTNQPGVQVYTGSYLPDPFTGICLEPQYLPDTPNTPEYGSAVLEPGAKYRHWTTYEFGCTAT